MAGLEELQRIVRDEIFKYASNGSGFNLRLYTMTDEARQAYSVIAVNFPKRTYKPGLVVMARVQGDQVIVEVDNTDRPVLDALLQAGIPREQIILAYAGEPVPDAEAATQVEPQPEV